MILVSHQTTNATAGLAATPVAFVVVVFSCAASG
jgi:hypothetical protein